MIPGLEKNCQYSRSHSQMCIQPLYLVSGLPVETSCPFHPPLIRKILRTNPGAHWRLDPLKQRAKSVGMRQVKVARRGRECCWKNENQGPSGTPRTWGGQFSEVLVRDKWCNCPSEGEMFSCFQCVPPNPQGRQGFKMDYI